MPYISLYQALILKSCLPATTFWCLVAGVICTIDWKFPTFWLAQVCEPTCPLHREFGTVPRTLSSTFNFVSSWCTCHWVKYFWLMHICVALRYCYELDFPVPGHGASITGKSISVLLTLLPVHQGTGIWNKGQLLLLSICEDDGCSSAQKTWGRYLH